MSEEHLNNLSHEQIEAYYNELRQARRTATPIGYWYSKNQPEHPMPVSDSATSDQVTEQLEKLDAFIEGAREVHYRGYSSCRLCGKLNGTFEYVKNGFAIPVGLQHYVEDHHVLVPGLLELP